MKRICQNILFFRKVLIIFQKIIKKTLGKKPIAPAFQAENAYSFKVCREERGGFFSF